MNNDAKIVDQNPILSQALTQPVAPVGAVHKEMGPIPSVVPEIRPSGPETSHEINQDLKEAGVKENQDRPDLTFEHAQIGLEHSGATAPVPTAPIGLVTIPSTGNVEDSGTWRNAVKTKWQKIQKLLGI